jgi:hypothetical protein
MEQQIHGVISTVAAAKWSFCVPHTVITLYSTLIHSLQNPCNGQNLMKKLFIKM